MRISLGANGTHQLKNFQAVRDWIQEEKAAWNWLNGRVGRTSHRQAVTRFQNGWQAIEDALRSGDEQEVRNAIAKGFGEDGQLIHSSSAAGVFLCRLAKKEPAVANAAALCYFLDPPAIAKIAQQNPSVHAGAVAWTSLSESLTGVTGKIDSIRQKGRRLTVGLEQQAQDFSPIVAKNPSRELIKPRRRRHRGNAAPGISPPGWVAWSG